MVFSEKEGIHWYFLFSSTKCVPRWPDSLPKDTLPKDILPKDILPNGHFADGRFAERTFCRTDILPNGHFAEWTFCRTDILPKIEISSELYRFAYTRSKFL